MSENLGSMEEVIFLSGANIKDGGPIQIYKNILNFICKSYPEKKIYAIVNSRKLFDVHPNLTFIEIESYKKFILLKFFYEYVYYYFISKKYNIGLWLSLNDCTPSVKAKTRVVYCHNATPFYETSLKDFLHPTISLFQSIYYSIFYRINLKKNNFIIVQQNWIKEALVKKYKADRNKIIVNHVVSNEAHQQRISVKSPVYTFIYPTKPQPYKNIDIIGAAIEEIERETAIKFHFIITIKGNESAYAKYLYKKYSHLKALIWQGAVSREQLEDFYSTADAMVFSSKLETWGLPITEFAEYKKPIVLIDLPYARETIGDYSYVKFFTPGNVKDLKKNMLTLINGHNLSFDENIILDKKDITSGFQALFKIIMKEA